MLIKFSDIEENVKTQKEYKEGVYKVKVVNAVEGVSNNGKEYLEIEFETIGEDVFKVRKRFYTSPKALSILLNFLSAVGLYDENNKDDVNFENDDLLGAVLEIELKKGEENAEGKRYLEYVAWSAKAVSGLATPKKTATKETKQKVEYDENGEEIPF